MFVGDEHLLGEEGRGFYLIMANFQWERLLMALGAVGSMRAGLERAIPRLAGRGQAARHAVAELATTLRRRAPRVTYHALRRFLDGGDAVREVTMAKLATQRASFDLHDRLLSLLGPDPELERAARDSRLGPIGGGSDEIMKEILGPYDGDLMADFGEAIGQAYATEGAVIDLGRGVHEDALAPEAVVRLPLATMNRHGLIAGATGTGKTKTLQLITEQLSAQGVPVFVADVKGDLSGLAEPAEAGGPAEKRMADLGLPFSPSAFPVEFLSLGGIGPGVPVRATVSDFGPQLLAKVLGSNETQESSLELVFDYADTKGLPLLDLGDLRALLTYLDSKDGKPELEGIGGLSKATVGVLLRSLVGLETGGGTKFFGEPQLDITDLMRVAPDGRGVISCLELPAVQDRPGLFSTVMMWLVAELFEQLPEAGDLDKPKLVFFLDEAHLLFADATDAFVESVTRTVRLIRSKGVGVFFVTQAPTDLPEGCSASSAAGSSTRCARSRPTPDLRAVVSTYPTSEFYDVGELLTAMGTGEAAVTLLSEKGVPTPVVHTRMLAPASKMAPVADVDAPAKASRCTQSTARGWTRRARARSSRGGWRRLASPRPHPRPRSRSSTSRRRSSRRPRGARRRPEPGGVGDFLNSRQGKALQREVMRGVFGMLKKRL